MAKFQIIVDENQLRIISNALDIYSRIGIGHLEAISDVLSEDINTEQRPKEAIHNFILSLKSLKQTLFKFDGKPIESNAHLGISSNNVPDKYKTAYDIQCVIRRVVSKNNSGWNSEPLHVNRSVPLCEVKLI